MVGQPSRLRRTPDKDDGPFETAIPLPVSARRGAPLEATRDTHERIAGISKKPERSWEAIDAAGGYVLPGMVDLHCDAVEKQLSPRPSVEFPAALAFLEMDRVFASSQRVS